MNQQCCAQRNKEKKTKAVRGEKGATDATIR